MKKYSHGGFSGKISEKVSPHTKTRVSVYHSEQAGFDYSDGQRYTTICEDHGNLVTTPSQAHARSAAVNPSDWCEDCQTAGKTRTENFTEAKDVK
jgi:hypothetical protein